ncbi:MAG: PLP-dependent aspartate aminotransferase family protein [Chloroflexota bacterium]|nr:PLP-dependent aspartate aminotransferase family protein [Chloroflexota bacterium]
MNRRTRNDADWAIESVAVHAGEGTYQTEATSTTTPIFMASAFHFDSSDDLEAVIGNERPGFTYGRYGNPTTRAFESAVARLESAGDAIAFSSGMAAIYAALALVVEAGSTVVASRDIYGASFSILRTHLRKLGVTPVFVDITDLGAVEAAIEQHRPVAILAETISNPLLRVAEIPALVRMARSVGAKVLVDNTFATPLLVNPVMLGAHMAIHSSTKYIAGHGDIVGGVIAASGETVADLREQTKMLGAIPSPMDAWLSLRGLKTMPLRYTRQCESAVEVARRLSEDPRIARVIYPDAGVNPGGQFRSNLRGAIVSFEIAGAGQSEVFRLMDALEMVIPATTLGDVYSLMLYPAMASHRALTPEERTEVGISDSLVRLSVGVESPVDIFGDISRALDSALA